MRAWMREVVGLLEKRALLSCGHLGDYWQPAYNHRCYQFCAVCKSLNRTLPMPATHRKGWSPAAQ